MPHLTRGNAKIYYEDDGDGPPILLTHGFVASTGMWAGQVDAFKDRYRLIQWDMRGHGLTECPHDLSAYGQDITVADIKAILDHCGPFARRLHVHAVQRLPSKPRAGPHPTGLRSRLSQRPHSRAVESAGCRPSEDHFGERLQGIERRLRSTGQPAAFK